MRPSCHSATTYNIGFWSYLFQFPDLVTYHRMAILARHDLVQHDPSIIILNYILPSSPGRVPVLSLKSLHSTVSIYFSLNDEYLVDRLDYHRPSISDSTCPSPKPGKLPIDPDCTVHARNVPLSLLPNLRNLFMLFGRMCQVRTLSLQSAFVVFFSIDAALKALCCPRSSDFGPFGWRRTSSE